MSRPLTRAQALQNNAFLKALRRSGNIRLAAREIGMKYGTVQHRRAAHPVFAQRIEVALAFAQARLSGAGRQGPSAKGGAAGAHRTAGGEPVVVRRNDGKLQMRRAQPGKLTRQCEQAFLAALSATANVALSAAAAGAAQAAFYRRRRNDPGFAREMRLALEMGYERLEMALLEGWSIEGHQQDDWRHNEPLAIPPMTPAQALQLMYLHQKEARLWTTPVPDRLRPGETWEARSVMLGMIHEAEREREREKFRIAEAARRDRGEPTWIDWEAEGIVLPDLSQVTGWSKAKPHAASEASDEAAQARPAKGKAGSADEPGSVRGTGKDGRAIHKTDAALFGGWRFKQGNE